MDKDGELNLSFGMIFSIFLIVIFIALAFYVIPKFLNFQDKISVGKFIDDFENDIDKMWKSTQGSKTIEYSLPLEIEEICFDKKLRIYFKPLGVGGDFDYTEIKHIGILEKDCFDVVEGKLSLTIKKDFNEVLVRVE